MLAAGDLDQRITILERLAVGADANGERSEQWVPFAEVWANVQDALPSRGERLANEMNLAARPCRIRMRWRERVTSAMRVQIGTRVLQITAGPAELGRREGIEIMAEEVSTMGSGA